MSQFKYYQSPERNSQPQEELLDAELTNKVIDDMIKEDDEENFEEEERLEDLIPSDILPVFADNGNPILIKDKAEEDLLLPKANTL